MTNERPERRANDPNDFLAGAFFITVNAPMDQVIIGPFDSEAAAEAYAVGIRAKGHDAWVQTVAKMRADQEEYGTLPILAPQEIPEE